MFRMLEEFSNYSVSREGKIVDRLTGKETKTLLLKSGYKAVDLKHEGERYRRLVHRLVAATFISNPKSLPIVSHLDNDKENNHVTNLEYTSQRDKMSDLIRRDMRTGRNLLDKAVVKNIYLSKKSVSDTAKEFRVTGTVVNRIKDGTRYRALTEGLQNG